MIDFTVNDFNQIFGFGSSVYVISVIILILSFISYVIQHAKAQTFKQISVGDLAAVILCIVIISIPYFNTLIVLVNIQDIVSELFYLIEFSIGKLSTFTIWEKKE
jgi:uncharacterized membrane protein